MASRRLTAVAQQAAAAAALPKRATAVYDYWFGEKLNWPPAGEEVGVSFSEEDCEEPNPALASNHTQTMLAVTTYFFLTLTFWPPHTKSSSSLGRPPPFDRTKLLSIKLSTRVPTRNTSKSGLVAARRSTLRSEHALPVTWRPSPRTTLKSGSGWPGPIRGPVWQPWCWLTSFHATCTATRLKPLPLTA